MEGQPSNPETIATVKSLLESIEDKEVLLLKGTVLIPPFEKVMTLLNITHRALWAKSKQLHPGLPDFKTMEKVFDARQVELSKGTEAKLIRHLPFSQKAAAFLVDSVNQGYGLSAITGWIGAVDSGLFEQPVAKEFWISTCKRIASLLTAEMHPLTGIPDRLQAYISADITQRLGCPLAQSLYPELIATWGDAPDGQAPVQYQHLLSLDCMATLLRIGAWMMAEWQASNWEIVCAGEQQDRMIGLSLIPRFSPTDGWDSPIRTALEAFATAAGWQQKQTAVTFLGRLWGKGDSGPDVASKTRLLRNWVQLRPSRPSYEMLFDLARVCAIEHVRLQGLDVEVGDADHMLNANLLRAAEALSRLVKYLDDLGVAPELIGSALACYESEYRLARTALGFPVE